MLEGIKKKKHDRKMKEEQWDREREEIRQKNCQRIAKKKQQLDEQIREARAPTPE